VIFLTALRDDIYEEEEALALPKLWEMSGYSAGARAVGGKPVVSGMLFNSM
jgi:hypothetical protein